MKMSLAALRGCGSLGLSRRALVLSVTDLRTHVQEVRAFESPAGLPANILFLTVSIEMVMTN